MNKKNLVFAVATAFLSGEVMAHNAPTPPGMEKCYGISKSRSNECGTKSHMCATLSKKDKDPEAWIFLPKGACNKIVGGTTAPKEDK
jgi:uncharacterized membrane protein